MKSGLKGTYVLYDKALVKKLRVEIRSSGRRCNDCRIQFALRNSNRSSNQLSSVPGCLCRGTVRFCNVDQLTQAVNVLAIDLRFMRSDSSCVALQRAVVG